MYNASYYTPSAFGAYVVGGEAISASISGSVWLLSDAQSGCLFVGFFTAAFLFALYASGNACGCFRSFDVFSTELQIKASDLTDGGDSSGIRTIPATRKFGGVALWAGVSIGLALCGDALSYVAQHGWTEVSSALPLAHPSDAIGAGMQATLRLRAALISPTAAMPSSCTTDSPKMIGSLSPTDIGWSITGTPLGSVFATAAAFPGTLAASSLNASTVMRVGCDFVFATPALVPMWSRFFTSVARDAQAPSAVLALWAAAAPDNILSGRANALAEIGTTASAPSGALISVTLPAGYALVSWALTLTDGGANRKAYTELFLGPSSSLAGARGSGLGDSSPGGGGSRWGIPLPPVDVVTGMSPLTARAHAMRALLLPTRYEDRMQISGGVPLVGSGFRASVLGTSSANIYAAPNASISVFADSFTIALDVGDTLIFTMRSPILSTVQVLGLLSGLVFLSLLGARIVHDVLDVAFGARNTSVAQGIAFTEKIAITMACGLWKPRRALTAAPWSAPAMSFREVSASSAYEDPNEAGPSSTPSVFRRSYIASARFLSVLTTSLQEGGGGGGGGRKST